MLTTSTALERKALNTIKMGPVKPHDLDEKNPARTMRLCLVGALSGGISVSISFLGANLYF